MARINISFDTGSPDELFANFVDERLGALVKQKVPLENVDIDHNRKDSEVLFKGRFVNGKLNYDNGKVDVALEIPILFRPFEKEIRAGITENLKREVNRKP